MLMRALLVFLLFIPSAWAAIDTYEFSDPANRELFQQLAEELRCPKCQNQNLADSNSPIAADMRREIHRMVEEGHGGEQVVDFMVTRYGDFVRYRPKKDESTWVLWYGPIVLIGIGVVAIVLIASRRSKKTAAQPANAEVKTTTANTSTSADKDKLNKLLADYEDKGSD